MSLARDPAGRDNPGMGETAVPHGTIRYSDEGSGRPIVFIHGVQVNGRLWRKVAPALAADFRVIVPDWPLGSHELPLAAGADGSLPGLAQMVADFLDALDLRDVVLVSCDTGTAIAQQVAVDHPAWLGALVLGAGDALGHFFPPLFAALPRVARIPGGAALIGKAARVGAIWRSPLGFRTLVKSDVPEDIRRRYAEPLATSRAVQRDYRTVVGSVRKGYTLALAERLHEFGKPVLLVWSREDRVFPFKLAEQLAARFPDARIEEVEDARCFIPEDQPERLTELIREFARAPTAVSAA
jgi:pimeloyl-ACP methyl ester carboxylesterase